MSETTVERINREAAERRDRGERIATPVSEARAWLTSARNAWSLGNYSEATAAAAIATAIVTVG